MYYDIHCHVFNRAIVDKRMDILLSPVFKLIDEYDRKLPEHHLAELIEKGDNFLSAFMKMSSEEVFEVLDQYYQHEFVLTPLMMDLEFTDTEQTGKFEKISQRVWQEVALEFIASIRRRVDQVTTAYPRLAKPMKGLSSNNHYIWKEVLKPERKLFERNNFNNQIDELEQIAVRCTRVKPFLGIDARRAGKQDLTALIREKILAEGARFAGVKLYAPTGFSPTDPALFGENGVYELCEKYGIPITVHNSSEGFSTHANAVKVDGLVVQNLKLVQMNRETVRFSTPFLSLYMRNAIKERALALNHPWLWEKVLEKYPNLKLNLAHFGGREELMKYIYRDIALKKLSSNEYASLLESIEDPESKLLVGQCFVKKEIKVRTKIFRSVYQLAKNLDDKTRSDLWEVLYQARWLVSWSRTILDLLTSYPNTYTDLSCFSGGKSTEGVFSIKEPLGDFKSQLYDHWPEDIKNRILYGSDFFFVLLFGPTMENYIAEFKEVFGPEFDRIASRNPERFLFDRPAQNV